jgi:hypothetical protein
VTVTLEVRVGMSVRVGMGVDDAANVEVATGVIVEVKISVLVCTTIGVVVSTNISPSVSTAFLVIVNSYGNTPHPTRRAAMIKNKILRMFFFIMSSLPVAGILRRYKCME